MVLSPILSPIVHLVNMNIVEFEGNSNMEWEEFVKTKYSLFITSDGVIYISCDLLKHLFGKDLSKDPLAVWWHVCEEDGIWVVRVKDLSAERILVREINNLVSSRPVYRV